MLAIQRIIIILLFLSNLAIIGVNAETNVANWNELVNVRYSLYLDPEHTQPVENNIDNTINHIYLSYGEVPQEILNIYPSASSSYLTAWIRNIIGMTVGQTKDFVVPTRI